VAAATLCKGLYTSGRSYRARQPSLNKCKTLLHFCLQKGVVGKEGNGREGGMEMQQMGFWGPVGAAVVFGCRAADGNWFDFGVSAPRAWGDV